MDETKPDCNAIAVVHRTTFGLKHIFTLDKTELANCVKYEQGFILVGTTYLNLAEQIPSKGRLLFFSPELQLVHQMHLEGSV